MSMKAAELREMSNAELTKKLAELKEELFNLRFQHARRWTSRCFVRILSGKQNRWIRLRGR